MILAFLRAEWDKIPAASPRSRDGEPPGHGVMCQAAGRRYPTTGNTL
jgi:hypothetical protein